MVVMGPVYKSYNRTSKENDEQVAAEVQSALDDLRSRYGFGLILSTRRRRPSGAKRDLVPFGSSLWLRWSELGFSLSRTDKTFPAKVLRVGSYRGDRVTHNWPTELHRGQTWPWEGYWEQGFADDDQPPIQEPPQEEFDGVLQRRPECPGRERPGRGGLHRGAGAFASDAVHDTQIVIRAINGTFVYEVIGYDRVMRTIRGRRVPE